MKQQSVIRDWVSELTLNMQGSLLTCIRGPDGIGKENPAKEMVKAYRFTIMHPGIPGEGVRSFMGNQTGRAPHAIGAFFADLDAYPHHWLMHFMHGAEIIGEFHPDEGTAAWWGMVYAQFCHAFHVNCETVEQLQNRLRFNGEIK